MRLPCGRGVVVEQRDHWLRYSCCAELLDRPGELIAVDSGEKDKPEPTAQQWATEERIVSRTKPGQRRQLRRLGRDPGPDHARISPRPRKQRPTEAGTGSPMNGRRRLRPEPLMACAVPLAAFMAELDAALGNGSQIRSTVVRDPTLRLPAADQIR